MIADLIRRKYMFVIITLFIFVFFIINYSKPLWLYNRVIFGNIKITYTLKFKDLNFREFSILFALVIWVIFMGIYPTFFSN
jgi:NADH-quinone oxidoreductase subunit M